MVEHRHQFIEKFLFASTISCVVIALAYLSIATQPNIYTYATPTDIKPTVTVTAKPTLTRPPTRTPTSTLTATPIRTPTVTPTNDINETRFTTELNGKRGVFVYGNYFIMPPACVYANTSSAVITTQGGKPIEGGFYVTGVRVRGSTDYFSDCPYPATNFNPSTPTR